MFIPSGLRIISPIGENNAAHIYNPSRMVGIAYTSGVFVDVGAQWTNDLKFLSINEIFHRDNAIDYSAKIIKVTCLVEKNIGYEESSI